MSNIRLFSQKVYRLICIQNDKSQSHYLSKVMRLNMEKNLHYLIKMEMGSKVPKL